MVTLGTKKFWMNPMGNMDSEEDNQICKNTGYINIQLFSVNYKSTGNQWQKTFGGDNKIALTTSVTYQSGTRSIESASVQDFRTVKVNQTYNLGLQRNIAVKIPVRADALQLSVKMSAVHDDNLQAVFDLMNKPEFQSALQLAPIAVGQVITVSSLVKKLLTNSAPKTEMEAEYAGIISDEKNKVNSPVLNGRLTSGYLILISTNDGDPFIDVDQSKFELNAGNLHYDGEPVENTYIIFNISFEKVKGEDQQSTWFKNYAKALSHLNEMMNINITADEQKKILQGSRDLWIGANALLENDETYIHDEIVNIKFSMLNKINTVYKEYSKNYPAIDMVTIQPQLSQKDLEQIVGPNGTLKMVEHVLPATTAFLEREYKINPNVQIKDVSLSKIEVNTKSTAKILGNDTKRYIQELNDAGTDFNLIK